MEILLIFAIIVAGIISAVLLVNAKRIAKVRQLADHKNLQEQIDQLGTAFAQEFSGAGIVIGVIRHGRTYIGGYGSTESGSPPQSSSVFEVPAMANLFTSICLQALSDRKFLCLDDNIRTCLPPGVTLASQVKSTTLLHLATHTSGFPFLPKQLREKVDNNSQPYANIKREDIWTYLRTCAQKCRPGNFKKSDFGMGLLACLLEGKTKRPFSALVQQEICNPLGLLHTTAVPPPAGPNCAVQGHEPSGVPASYWKCGALFGAGAIYTNMEDILSFLNAHLCPQEGAIYQTLLRTHQKYAAGYSALGWQTSQQYEKVFGLKNLLWMAGRTAGFSAYMAIDPDQALAAAIITTVGVSVERYGTYLMHVLAHTSFHDESERA